VRATLTARLAKLRATDTDWPDAVGSHRCSERGSIADVSHASLSCGHRLASACEHRRHSYKQQDERCRLGDGSSKRANLVKRAEDWRWSSLHRWKRGTPQEKSLFAAWPLARRPGWIDHVDAPQTDAELAALRRSLQRGCPFGDESWSGQMVRKPGLESTLRPRGRPRKR
jgi:hypothetical protein